MTREESLVLFRYFVGYPKQHPDYDTVNGQIKCGQCGASFDNLRQLTSHHSSPNNPCESKGDNTSLVLNPKSEREEGEHYERYTPVDGEEVDRSPGLNPEYPQNDTDGDLSDYTEESPDTTSDTEETEDNANMNDPTQIMSKEDWKETVQLLLNSDEPDTDYKAERIMSEVF
jgi:hypothetical protein